ncbi:hypothetical protein K501DRAFT_174821 [Backusella circina FSU 941]|nr:hypothetical protein K501DRAFT_174821 [Backusella circina FSU 941]
MKKEQDHPAINQDDYDTTDLEKLDSKTPTNSAKGFQQQGVRRGLSTRHIQMIAIGGTIGTGIFLNSGRTIADAGPAGALIAYIIIGFLVYCIVSALGEMSTYMPISGSVYQYATRFVDKSLGFSLGRGYTKLDKKKQIELTSAASIIRFWKTVMPDPAWAAIFWIILVSMNFLSVRVYGETEYWFCIFKVLIVLVFIIVGILVTTGAVGGRTIGFEYWKDPGSFTEGGLGIVYVLLSAGYSFLGSEAVGTAAGEAKNPTKSIPRAIRSVFWRILVFYIATILLISMCIPSTDPRLSFSDSDSATASFTLVFEQAGIKAGAHVINAAVLTSVLSAGNSMMYASTRILLGMAEDGNAPKILTRVNRFGSPYYAVFASSILGFICIFISVYGANNVLAWLLNLAAISGFMNWAGIAFVQLRFRRGYVYQGRDIRDLPYKAFLYPYGSIISGTVFILILLGQGYVSFYPKWDAVTFVTSYIGFIPLILAYVCHKLITKSKIVPLDEIDFDTGRATQDDIDDDNESDTKWKKWIAYLT